MLFPGVWGKMIHEKNLKQKISWHYPFNPPPHTKTRSFQRLCTPHWNDDLSYRAAMLAIVPAASISTFPKVISKRIRRSGQHRSSTPPHPSPRQWRMPRCTVTTTTTTTLCTVLWEKTTTVLALTHSLRETRRWIRAHLVAATWPPPTVPFATVRYSGTCAASSSFKTVAVAQLPQTGLCAMFAKRSRFAAKIFNFPPFNIEILFWIIFFILGILLTRINNRIYVTSVLWLKYVLGPPARKRPTLAQASAQRKVDMLPIDLLASTFIFNDVAFIFQCLQVDYIMPSIRGEPKSVGKIKKMASRTWKVIL